MSILNIVENKKARMDFEILNTYEAGVVLVGSEVKSLRIKQCQIKDAYVLFKGDEAYIHNLHISVYKASSYNNHEPERDRKLLLNKAEIIRLKTQINERGFSCVPLKIYFKNGKVKIELGLGRGRKKFDKRDDIKKRDANRELRDLKRS